MKTTKKHFELFKRECRKWLNVFNLNNWEANYYHRDLDGSIASSTYFFDAKYVKFSLATEWNIKPIQYEIRKSAFHEVCECLLFELRYKAECRFLTDSEIEPAVHDIIHRLELVIFDNN